MMYRLLILIYCFALFVYVFINIRRSFSKYTIRKRIQRVIGLQILLLIMLFASLSIIFFHDNNYLSTRSRLQTAAQAKIDHIDHMLEYLAGDIEMMSVANAYRDVFNTEVDYDTRYNQVNRRMETIISYRKEFVSINVVDKSGYVVASSLHREGEYVGGNEFFNGSLEGLNFGRPVYNENFDKKILPVGFPILLNEEVVGIIMINYNFDEIESILSCEDCLGEYSEMYIVDDQNYVLSTLDEYDNVDLYPLDKTLFQDVKEQADSKSENIFQNTKDYSGKKVALTVIKSSVLDWYLFSQIEYNATLTQVYFFVALEIFVACILLLMARVGSKQISKNISEPIEKLTDDVDIVASGDFEKKVVIESDDELGKLSREIDNMATEILKSRKDVDKKIGNQTKQLADQEEKLRKQQLALLNILEDVSLEKKEIENQRNKLDIILEGIGDGVFAVNSDGLLTRFNKVASDISGFEDSEVLGKQYKEVLVFRKEKDNSLYYDFIEKAFKTGKVQNMANHTYLERKDGTHVSVADSAAPIKNEEGRIVGVVVVFRDVTKENEINKMKDEFVSVASHQLRTPLTGIKWYIQLLLKKETGKLTSTQTNFIRSIYDSNERMIKLVDDLLSVSRIDTGRKFEIKKKKVNIVKSFKDVIKTQEVIAEERKM